MGNSLCINAEVNGNVVMFICEICAIMGLKCEIGIIDFSWPSLEDGAFFVGHAPFHGPKAPLSLARRQTVWGLNVLASQSLAGAE